MHQLSSLLVFAVIVLILSALTSCSSEPEPINYGHDECDFCRMLITDNRYGCELITDKGKVFKFDEAGCMIEYALVENLIGDANQKFLVTVFSMPETFTDATSVHFVKDDDYRSPMGLNVMAFDRESDADDFTRTNESERLNWIEVIELVKQRSM